MSKLFILLVLFFNLNAFNVLKIDENFCFHDSCSYIYYIEDVNESLKPEEIMEHEELILSHKTHIGSHKGPFWSRLQIKNDTDDVKQLYMYNPLAGTNEIDVYVYKEGNLLATHTLGDLREQSKRDVVNRHSLFILTLLPHESSVVISKVKNYYMYNIGWVVQSAESFLNSELNELVIFGLITGVLVFFAIYNLLLFRMYKEYIYLIIALNIFLVLGYLYSFHGVTYQLNLGINLSLITAFTWNTTSLNSIALLLFPYIFFKVGKNYKKIAYFMRTLLALFSLTFIVALYAQYFNNEYLVIFKISLFLALLNTFSLLLIAIYMYIKKEIGSSYYLFGQGVLILSIFVHILTLLSVITHTDILKYLLPLGLIGDMMFLTYAQYVKKNYELQELKRTKEILLEKSRYNSVGQVISNITHQWKQPLTYIGTTMTFLETIYNYKKEKLVDEFVNKLPDIKENIKFMSHTIDEFSNYYSGDIIEKHFSPKSTIENILNMLSSKLTLKNVSVDIYENNVKSIYGYEHIFSNIMLVLIDNSIDEFKEKSENMIEIFFEDHKDSYKIIYKDSAGGIKVTPIEDVFKYDISLKDKKSNKGIGLAIAKMLIEDKMLGSIGVKNIDKGVEFTIKLQKNTKEIL